jgi:23S rRNA (cytidine1920-2'-O)/16S rRNA (cytidine1409-2'-O)-methyltransferase
MNKPLPKSRLDVLLVERGHFDSREKAQRAILAGDVYSNDHRLDKSGTRMAADAPLEVRQKNRYVGRGGLKLEAALKHFELDPTGATCLDVGASTGGFTDCLLQHGARHVYAVDVGHSQLDWKIRSDPRVTVWEKVNARHLAGKDFPEQIGCAVIDVSFISLTLILPAVADVLRGASTAAASITMLIKPQFELSRGEVGQGGIVREPELHAQCVAKIQRFVEELLPTWRWTGVIDSPILGTEGNKEFLACLQRSSG